MANNFRRTAKKVINSRGNHGLLGLMIFDEKLVCQNYKKLVNSKANSSLALLKWAKNEENKAIKDVFSKTFEVTGIWTAVWTGFLEEYQKYRKTFKELLHEEQVLDEATKQEAVYAAKLSRLQKQQAKGRSSKALMLEMTEVISQAEKAHAELEVKHTQHEILKARRLRSGLHKIADGLQKWAEESIAVSKAYRNLANLIPDTPTQFTADNIYPGVGQSRTIVSELAAELKIKPEFSAELAATAASHGSKGAYLYAVSPQLRQNSPEEEYAQPTTTNAKSDKVRKPQPLPKSKSKANAAKLRSHGRPVSVGDVLCAPPSSRPPPCPINNLRPAPSQQPNGKLWYARTKVLTNSRESDSEDSDGYTEPISHVTHSISDSVLNRLQEQKELSAKEPGTGETMYHHLTRLGKGDVNDNAAYVDLCG